MPVGDAELDELDGSGSDSDDGGSGSSGRGRSGDDSGSGDAGSVPGDGSRTGSGVGGGGGAGTGARKRGRPRKDAGELAGAVPRPTLTERPTAARRHGPDLSVLVETTVVGLFGLVAVATAHEHWLKTNADVAAITGPLNAWIDQLPSKSLKKIEKNLAPALVVVGLAVVIGPDVVVEVKLREQDRASRAVSPPQPGPLPGVPGGHPPASGADPAANGSHHAAGRNTGWYSSIPTASPIGSEFHVGH